MFDKQKILKWRMNGLIALLVIACLWVPETQKILGRIFTWDEFRNWDSTIMLPGWAYLNHEVLNKDIFSPWGMGAVVFISRSAQMLGGFDEHHVLLVLMMMVIVYFCFLYAFLREWLGSIGVAAAVVAVAIKVQMFNSGISPLIWIFPQDTAVRHWLDIPVLWWLWRHARAADQKYLTLSAIGIGAALAWNFTTGLCLLGGFWGYLVYLALTGIGRRLSYKDIRRKCLDVLLPLAVMVLVLFLLQGPAVFELQCWKNLIEPVQLFLHGVGMPSFYACLYDRHFFAFIVSFVIPVIYVGTLMVAARRQPFLVVLCLYGLGLYVHYLAHATTSHYYSVGVPVVMVLGWWAATLLKKVARQRRLKILFLLTIAAWGALFTNILFVYYPNIFNIARMDWKPEMALYQSAYNFDQDAAMISRLTPPGERAAVVSSFETRILMQANRGPFFYYAPLVSSERMDSNAFDGTSLITPQRLHVTGDQFAQKAPEYVYVEKRLLGQWPAQYVQSFPGIVVLLRYINDHYVPFQQGQYLIAMHRKAE